MAQKKETLNMEIRQKMSMMKNKLSRKTKNNIDYKKFMKSNKNSMKKVH